MRPLSAALLALLLAGCAGGGARTSPTSSPLLPAPAATASAAPAVTPLDAAPAHATAPSCTNGERRPLTTARAATVLYVKRHTEERRGARACAPQTGRLAPQS